MGRMQKNKQHGKTPKKSPLSKLMVAKFSDEYKKKAKSRLQQWKEPALLTSVCYLLGDVSVSTTTPAPDIEDVANLFRDLDLAIFGSPPDDYKLYTEQLLAEYGHIDSSHFRCMRLKLLQTFLTIPCIYTTDVFRARFESAARANIECEIEELKK